MGASFPASAVGGRGANEVAAATASGAIEIGTSLVNKTA